MPHPAYRGKYGNNYGVASGLEAMIETWIDANPDVERFTLPELLQGIGFPQFVGYRSVEIRAGRWLRMLGYEYAGRSKNERRSRYYRLSRPVQ